MKAVLKAFTQVVVILGETLLILIAFVMLQEILGTFFIEISGITPPGAAGISNPWLLMVALTSLLFFCFAWLFTSAVPCVGAAFWVAFGCGEIAFIDTRTPLAMAYDNLSTWQVYEPVVEWGSGVLVVLLSATWAGRVFRAKLFPSSSLPNRALAQGK